MPPFARVARLALAIGVATAAVMLFMDHLFFGGVSLPRIRSTASLPLWMRLLLPVYAAVTEELIYRFGLMTLFVWLGALACAPPDGLAPPYVVWIAIAGSAVLFGLAHIANVPDAPSPILRAVALNGFAATVLGCLYWKAGFEAAVLAHFGADVFIYLIVASVL